jgi:type VII secretion-associated serine protease mycosin
LGAKRVWSTAGVVTLAGALLLISTPTASADNIRDQQWVLDAFKMQDTWSLTQGEGVTVAVVDTGVDASHPDLTGQVLKGKDFTGGGNAQEDVAGHGTSMASLIAGRGHGSGGTSGMVGFAPKVKILPLRVLEKADDKLLDETWASAVRYAVDHGAQVINLSFSDATGNTITVGREAIAYAQAHDVVVVAGVGNDGNAVDEPAGLPGVVGAGAVDKKANRWAGSNTGKGLSLMAPGADVLAADPTRDSGYSVTNGTSHSTAYVSAAAALVRAKYPDLTAGQVINRLVKSASFLHHKGLKAPDREYGYGIIRPNKALTMDIPAGPKEGPLGALPSDTASKSAGNNDGSSEAAEQSNSSSRSGLPLVLGGGIVGILVIAGIIFAVMRSRRNRGGGPGGPGAPGGGMPYPPQQQPYPTSAPGQQYPTPPGQSPQQHNPYGQ